MPKIARLRRLFLVALAALLFVGVASVGPSWAIAADDGTYGFSDVTPGDWYANDECLGYAVEHRIMNGYQDGRFGPDDPVTRAQVATVLWNMASNPKATSEPFEDVDYDEWYGPAILWARSVGVVGGYKDPDGVCRTFGPNDYVTREQLCTMLSNYASVVGGLDTASDCKKLDAMPDAYEVSDWARLSVGWSMDEGLVSGALTGGVAWVRPRGTANRAALSKMASALHRRVYGGSEEGPDLEPKPGPEEGPSYAGVYDGLTFQVGTIVQTAQDGAVCLEFYGDAQDGAEDARSAAVGHEFGGTGSGGGAGSGVIETYGYGAIIVGVEGSVKQVSIPNKIDGVEVLAANLTLDSANSADITISASNVHPLRSFDLTPLQNSVTLSMGSLPELREFSVSMGAGLSGVDLSESPKLRRFVLDGVDLNGSFGFATENLEELSIVNVGLDTFSLGDDISKLKTCVVVGTGCRGDFDFSRSPNVEYIDVSHNRITSVNISGCEKLKVLDCYNNEIADTSALEAWLAQPGHTGNVGNQRVEALPEAA